MTPQSSFMVVAPLDVTRTDELRSLLATMNREAGTANPDNDLVPFRRFPELHFARIMILEDQTLDDITQAYGQPRQNFPTYLAFLADFDGDADRFRKEMVNVAGPGLQRIFSYCTDFTPGTDLVRWMEQHEHPSATTYINWVGRSMQQIREEKALSEALRAHLFKNGSQFQQSSPEEVRRAAKEFVGKEVKLTSLGKAPLSWRIRNLVHLIFVPIVLLVFSPLLLLYLPIFFIQLRRREKSDMEIAPRPPARWVEQLARIEDHDCTNQFTALGSVKPGLFRRWTFIVLLWLLEYSTRHIYTRGHLARVPTIHCARWVFLDVGSPGTELEFAL